MRLIFKYLIIIVLLFGCKSKYSNNLAKNTFKDKVELIKVLSLPVIFDCSEYPGYDNSPKLDTTLKRPEVTRYLVGRLFPDNTNIILVYAEIGDICYPSIYTYTLDGKPISNLFISGGCSGIPLGCFTSYSTRITADQTITIIDSLGSYELDKNDDKISGTETGEVTIRRFKLETTGFFTLLSESKSKIQ